MSLLQIERLTKSFGTEILFEPFSAQVGRGDRIALIGDNGVGKSTLLRIICGDETATEGGVRPIGSPRIAYLPQLARLNAEGTLWQAMEQPFEGLRRIEAELRRIEGEMASSSRAAPDEEALHRYDDLLHRFDREGGYVIESRVRAALAGVGFREGEYAKSVRVLSGGEEARAALARTLLEAPDLLLLDEPTNHLDFAALDWLEEQLSSFGGAILMVSHDRHLLDRVANRTWEIALGRVSIYRMGYEASREARRTERARHLEAYDKQEETIEKYRDFIRRHKVGQKHRQAKDREKKLERIERERIERPKDARRISLRIRTGQASGKRVLSLHDLAIGFDEPLFTCDDIELYRGEKVAIIGPNGCGKTTLLKTICGELSPLRGKVETGHNVHPATYSQTQEGLHGPGTVLDAILARAALTFGEARGLLGRFLFSGDDVEKKVNALSGGERSRVALALVSLIEGNLLLFDEPTNHLDLASQEILERALVEYDGTLLLVSHDRALLEAITTQVWLVDGDRLHALDHGYTEYRKRLREDTARDGELARRPQPSTSQEKPNSRRSSHKPDRYALKRQADQREHLEAEIERLETRIAEIEEELAQASAMADARAIASLGSEHKETQATLATKYEHWHAIAEEREAS